MNDEPAEHLIHNTKETYGDAFGSDLLEQYRVDCEIKIPAYRRS